MDDKYKFRQITSPGSKGYDTQITGFGPDIVFDLLVEDTMRRNKENMSAKFENNTSVSICVPTEQLMRFLLDDHCTTSEARMTAMYIEKYGGVITGTEILEGKRYYHVECGPDGIWQILPEEFLEPIERDMER